MSKARDVIARALASVGAFDSEGEATVVDMALHAAGYRIAGPEDRVIGKGEYDPVTVEAAVKIAERHADENDAQAKKLMQRAAKMRRIGDPFGHGDMAADGCAELTAAQHEAVSIAAAIRNLGRKA